MEVVKDVELVKLGDMEYDADKLTAAEYFDYVKGMKNTIDDEYTQKVIDNGLKMIQKCKITRQTEMAKQITHIVEVALRELQVARLGFNVYVSRKAIEKYITDVDSKSVKIIELSRYTRDIPDDKVDIISQAQDVFDELYVVFTDYTYKDSKMVAKERRSKDPIVFGAFLDKRIADSSNIYVEDRMFFICDWVDDLCDLTLKEIVQTVKENHNKDIVYKVTNSEEAEDIKKYLNSFKTPLDDPNNTAEPVPDFFGKVKSKIKKAASTVKKARTSRKKKEE